MRLVPKAAKRIANLHRNENITKTISIIRNYDIFGSKEIEIEAEGQEVGQEE